MLTDDDIKAAQASAIGIAAKHMAEGEVALPSILSMLAVISQQIAQLPQGGLPPLPPTAFGFDGGVQ